MYFKPPHRTKWEAVQAFLYERETGRVFGRTGSSWAKIGLFYLIFYSILASMFAIMLWVFFQTLDPRMPKWQLTGSLIGTNPGLGYRPRPPSNNVDSTLIWYRGSDPENYKMWRNSLVEYLEVYRKPGLTPGRGQNIYNCDYDRPPTKGQVCDVDVKNWAPCVQETNFNYHKSGPCVFLKLNKIYGWVPQFYNDTRSLPPSMPKDLKAHIEAVARNSSLRLNTIWVSCEGENPLDVENIGPVKYLPAYRGFPGYFYPYTNSEGYLSPLVAVHFERPKTGVLIQIECKAWAKNIRFDRKERVGSVHLELMID